MIEERIATESNSIVLNDDFEFAVSIAKSNLANAQLDISTIAEINKKNQVSLIQFGIALLHDPEIQADDEEYPLGEEPNDQYKSKTVATLGLQIGFSIQYAIYYHYLSTKDTDGLIDYLKLSRIPNPKKFANRLLIVFEKSNTG